MSGSARPCPQPGSEQAGVAFTHEATPTACCLGQGKGAEMKNSCLGLQGGRKTPPKHTTVSRQSALLPWDVAQPDGILILRGGGRRGLPKRCHGSARSPVMPAPGGFGAGTSAPWPSAFFFV